MRNIMRIYELIDLLRTFWLKYPDLRFGQVFAILAANLNAHDDFYVEDEEWIKTLRQSIGQPK